MTGAITTGNSVTIASQEIPASGGRITVTDENSPLRGLEVIVPANSYDTATSFTLSTAPIEKHTFGKAFKPVTPLITIDNGGAYADEIMSVTIPVQVPEDQFAMGFFYDAASQKLSGMNLISSDANSITVGTRHFSSFLVSMISRAELREDIDSGFRPGVDDWQFPNYGSYITPDGHCAGQSLTALWYYVTKPDGPGATLYGRYDNNGQDPATPSFWYDDSLGYRLVSVVHESIDWGSVANTLWTNLSGVSDEVTYNLFAYAMKMTGEPQETGIFSKVGHGHDMICYRVKDGELYIADPNYPGDTGRRIKYENGAFLPYNSALNAQAAQAGQGESFETIEYCAKTTTIDWKTIEQHWSELKEGTIGKGIFPDYRLVVSAPEGDIDLTDGYVSADKKVKIKLLGGRNGEVGLVVCRNGIPLTFDADTRYELQPGDNLLGMYIDGTVGGSWKYVDFKYLNIVYPDLQISPEHLDGEVNTEYTFIAATAGSIPNSTYKWLVDGKLILQSSAMKFQTSFSEPGKHNVRVDLMVYDRVRASAEVDVRIGGALAPQDTAYVSGYFSGRVLYHGENPESADMPTVETQEVACHIGIPNQRMMSSSEDAPMKLTWNGDSFSSSYTVGHSTHSLSGTVSKDWTRIETLSYTYLFDGLQSSVNAKQEVTLVIQNLPLTADAEHASYTATIAGSELRDHLVKLSVRDTPARFTYHYTQGVIGIEDILWDKQPQFSIVLSQTTSR